MRPSSRPEITLACVSTALAARMMRGSMLEVMRSEYIKLARLKGLRGGTVDVFGYTHLVDPEFINANAISLLERARAAQKTHAPIGEGARFRLPVNTLTVSPLVSPLAVSITA